MGTHESTHLTTPAELSSLEPATKFVRTAALEAGMPGDEIGKIELALEEIFVNAALYAYPKGESGTIEISCATRGPKGFILEISDHGRSFDPLAASAPDLSAGLESRPVGGLGIFLVRSLATSVSYRREEGRNRLILVFEDCENH